MFCLKIMKILPTLAIYLSLCLVGSAELKLVSVDRFLHIRDDASADKLEIFVRLDQITQILVANSKEEESNAFVSVSIEGSMTQTIHFSTRKNADAAAAKIRARILGLRDRG